MEAELIVISGPLSGASFPLGEDEIRIGRAPDAKIRLTESGVAWEHCAVRPRDGCYHLVDLRSGTGAFVNGVRVSDHRLAGGDQVSVGETTLLYREEASDRAEHAPQTTLLRACSILFLFRALAMAEQDTVRNALENQILDLIAGLVPCLGSAVLLGRTPQDLAAAGQIRSAPVDLSTLSLRACEEGPLLDSAAMVAAYPLEVHGELCGLLAVWFPPEEAANLPTHHDALGAIATLAVAALETVRDVERLQTENLILKERLSVAETGIVGESNALHKLLSLIARVSPQDVSVLILGESGTGKELVARALHRLSPRSKKPFVAINCAAITESLLESELFGHEKGAFTGAIAQKKGKLEIAEGGTVFLDEIGELPQPVQAKLLRVLQQREFERVGGTRTLQLNVRMVAATNRDLAAEVRRGAFRDDLYHRLNVVALRVPPLRERPADIMPLAHYFLERSAARCQRHVVGISPEAESRLMMHTWPGNVRELENAIERAVVLGDSEVLLPEDLPETVADSAELAEPAGALLASVAESKRQLILAAWRETGGDHNQAAAKLNIHPNSLRRLIRTLNLREALSSRPPSPES